MTAIQLISNLEKQGIELLAAGNVLLVSPPGLLSIDQRELVRSFKQELLRVLKARPREPVSKIDLDATEMLIRALGAEVETPVGTGTLVYITQHGAVVQAANGFMYTLDPRKVTP